jgi:hypothetical protein
MAAVVGLVACSSSAPSDDEVKFDEGATIHIQSAYTGYCTTAADTQAFYNWMLSSTGGGCTLIASQYPFQGTTWDEVGSCTHNSDAAAACARCGHTTTVDCILNFGGYLFDPRVRMGGGG